MIFSCLRYLIHSAALASAERSRGSPGESRDSVSGWPRQQAREPRPGHPPLPPAARAWAGLRHPPGTPSLLPVGPDKAAQQRGLVFHVPCAGWSGDFACFGAHLPANALTLSAPIIIQSALLRAAIP